VSEHPHGATTIRASKGGGASKWLIGGVAAVVIAGGAYAAWKTVGSGQQQSTEIAYEDPYAEDPLRAGPLEAAENAPAEAASAEQEAAPAAPRRAAAPPRRATASSEVVPEETIGVTPASVTEEEVAEAETGDDIIVRARPRPVWTRTPSERRLTSLYPARALERGREGEARLSCTVQEGGALACATVEETPGGFGNAALRVARTYRHSPTRADGTDATGTPVNLRVVFRLEDEERPRFASR
jgi:TonB family protein